jgi:hypothetical protein
MTSPVIGALRLSMIWTLPVRIPFRTAIEPLADDGAYKEVFAPRKTGTVPRFEPPWTARTSSLFWTFYLSRQPLTVDAAIARACLVPIRERLPPIATTVKATRVGLEAFYAHTGLAVVLTASIAAEPDVPDVVDRAIALRRDRVLSAAAGAQRAEDIAAESLSKLHANVTGAALPAGALVPPPFSIATVVRLDGAIDPSAVVQDDDRHRVVDALVHLDPDWRTTALPELAKLRLDIKQSPASHLLYARGRTRAVWYPSHARADSEHRTRLSCYHRNLTLASMQTELLLDYSAMLARLDAPPSARETDDVTRAQHMLQRLHGRSSYRSGSVLAQINARKDEVNAARTDLGLPAL